MSTATLHIKKKKALVPKLRFQEFDGEWEKNILKEICTFFSGGTPTSTDKKLYNGNIPFIGSGNIYDSEVKNYITEEALNGSSAKLVKIGDILYALYGANSGEVAISKMQGAINQAILCIRTKSDFNEFVYYLLLLNKDKIVSKYLQGGQGNLSADIIKKLKYSFPSLPEQQKIASFLSVVDEKIQQLSRKKELLSQYKKGVMQQLFSGKLRFKDENGKDYADWDILSIEDLVNRKILAKPLDGNHGNIHPVSSDFVTTGIPFIMANNIRSGKLNLEGVTCIKKEQADKLQKGFSFEGDVLLTHKGSVGLTAIVQKLQTEYIMLTPQVTYYRVIDKQKLNNLFLKTVFDSSIFQKRLQTLADSGTRPYIGITMQRNLEIPFPSLSEQQKIANFLSNIDTKIEATNQQINQTESFKKGLLQQLFV